MPWADRCGSFGELQPLPRTLYPLLLTFRHVFPGDPLAIGTAALAGVVVFGIDFERNKRVARYIIAVILSPLFRVISRYRAVA